MKAVALAFGLLMVGLTGCRANPCNKLRECCNAVQSDQSLATLGARLACGFQPYNGGVRDACSRTLDSVRQSIQRGNGTVPAACNP